jgi:hypothetical protein
MLETWLQNLAQNMEFVLYQNHELMQQLNQHNHYLVHNEELPPSQPHEEEAEGGYRQTGT